MTYMQCGRIGVLSFLYPFTHIPQRSLGLIVSRTIGSQCKRLSSTTPQEVIQSSDPLPFNDRLNPPPEDYGRTIFADKCTLNLHAGSGGHGCASFLREKYISAGPPNGGDGGSGGNVYIQAVRNETSLHKLARRGILRAGRGKNGQGKNKGGQRGEDTLIQVPVGTVIREISRSDPVADEAERAKFATEGDAPKKSRSDKWIVYPSAAGSYGGEDFPELPRPRKSNMEILQPPAPISLDLSQPMEKPMLLAAGAVGGLGNPHFVSQDMLRPRFATKGESGMKILLELELKLLADVGFVGFPNAGKSTLLRALSRSRARVGNWAFTTLQPNIGTVVLDDSHGRPKFQARTPDGEVRTQFSIADIPGLVPDAHLDRGLGLGFLRHIERARVLAFVIDLSSGSPIQTLQTLWKELEEFEKLKEAEVNAHSEQRIISWKAFGSSSSNSSSVSRASPEDGAISPANAGVMLNASKTQALPELSMPPISTKPWFVVATKADLESTQDKFAELQGYLQAIGNGAVAHPSGRKNSWKGPLCGIPVSAIRGEGVDRIAEWTVGLLYD